MRNSLDMRGTSLLFYLPLNFALTRGAENDNGANYPFQIHEQYRYDRHVHANGVPSLRHINVMEHDKEDTDDSDCATLWTTVEYISTCTPTETATIYTTQYYQPTQEVDGNADQTDEDDEDEDDEEKDEDNGGEQDDEQDDDEEGDDNQPDTSTVNNSCAQSVTDVPTSSTCLGQEDEQTTTVFVTLTSTATAYTTQTWTTTITATPKPAGIFGTSVTLPNWSSTLVTSYVLNSPTTSPSIGYATKPFASDSTSQTTPTASDIKENTAQCDTDVSDDLDDSEDLKDDSVDCGNDTEDDAVTTDDCSQTDTESDESEPSSTACATGDESKARDKEFDHPKGDDAMDFLLDTKDHARNRYYNSRDRARKAGSHFRPSHVRERVDQFVHDRRPAQSKEHLALHGKTNVRNGKANVRKSQAKNTKSRDKSKKKSTGNHSVKDGILDHPKGDDVMDLALDAKDHGRNFYYRMKSRARKMISHFRPSHLHERVSQIRHDRRPERSEEHEQLHS